MFVPDLQRKGTRPVRNILSRTNRGRTLDFLARHECGTKICRKKGIEYAHRLLGHSNISTIQRYLHLDDQELAEAQDLID